MIKWSATFADPNTHITEFDGIEVKVYSGLLGGWKVSCPELGIIGGVCLSMPDLENAKAQALRLVTLEMKLRCVRYRAAIEKIEVGMEGSK